MRRELNAKFKIQNSKLRGSFASELFIIANCK